MKKFVLHFSGIVILLLIFSCNEQTGKKQNNQNNLMENMNVTYEMVEKEFDAGNFKKATELINRMLATGKLSEKETYKVNWKKDLMRRIKLDFTKTEDEIKKQLEKYYPDLTEEQMRKWEENNELEMKTIDGQRRYFKYAKNNLFRISVEEKKVKETVDGIAKNSLTEYCAENAPRFIEEVRKTNSVYHSEKKMHLTYTVTVDANVVPDGELIRCWLPFPIPNKDYQYDIELVDINTDKYVLAPQTQLQRTIYLEKMVKKDIPTEFRIELNIKTKGRWYGDALANIKPYDKSSELYNKFTKERAPQIVFSEPIKKLSDKIVGNEEHPLTVIRKVYTWIDNNIPWASAREYSTISNIPEYVIDNKHGDCGQQTLLLITLLRYNGIPAKWQSGWYLIPGNVNLHDWAEVYIEGVGWVPVDPSFELIDSENDDVKNYYTCGLDPYRLVVNNNYGKNLFPMKIYPRSEPIDFQRGELEWQGGNLYFDKWSYNMDVEYIK